MNEIICINGQVDNECTRLSDVRLTPETDELVSVTFSGYDPAGLHSVLIHVEDGSIGLASMELFMRG